MKECGEALELIYEGDVRYTESSQMFGDISGLLTKLQEQPTKGE